jgi:hypothetical protein
MPPSTKARNCLKDKLNKKCKKKEEETYSLKSKKHIIITFFILLDINKTTIICEDCHEEEHPNRFSSTECSKHMATRKYYML